MAYTPFRIDDVAHLLKNLSVDFKEDYDYLRQVIVNTHSPVLLITLIQWRQDPNVSVWLSKQNTLITEVNGIKIKLKVSRVSLIIKESDNNKQLLLFDSVDENERKLTLTEAANYVETGDAEKAIQSNIMTQIIIGYTTEGTTDVRLLESILQRTFESVAKECKMQVDGGKPRDIDKEGNRGRF